MELRQAERKRAYMKMALQGSSGSGKTMSALVLAEGLCGNLDIVAVIDTEAGSANLYAHLGPYQVLSLEAPHTPERYIEAVTACLQAGMEVIIIDSISHCWEWLLEYHGNLQGNSFANWNKVTPRHRAFIDCILQAKAHVIATMRSKTDYALSEKNGKQVPEKVGLKAVQRDGVDYEFTLVFDLDNHHQAKASKDRTSMFADKPEFVITKATGQKILDWCQVGISSLEAIKAKIRQATRIEDLNALYRQYPESYQSLEPDFKQRKAELVNHFVSPDLKSTIHGVNASL